MHKFFLPVFLFFSFNSSAEYIISGQLKDSERKYAVVQLSFVSSIEDIQSADSRSIINEVQIDSIGHFFMKGNDLPNEKALYRLTLVNEFSATSISVGINRNFNLLVLDNNSKISLETCKDVSISFNNCKINGSSESKEIQFFYDVILPQLYKDGSFGSQDISETKISFLKEKYLAEFRNYCDTSRYLLSSLVAYQLSKKFEEGSANDRLWTNKFLEKVSNQYPSSPYVKDLEFILAAEQGMYYKLENQKLKTWVYIISFCFLMALVLSFFLWLRLKKHSIGSIDEAKPTIDSLKQSLSAREREVLLHIEAGKSNKEIAQAMFIEVSTVKSHQTKIYQKLGVKSRNELMK